ncbi:hypothetical protein NFI96_007787 [Prochilodus magdalenae]|nr:hypothetical protein NFI96_007787 [Prochilodus magdalenae]
MDYSLDLYTYRVSCTIGSGTVCRAAWNGFPWRAAAFQPYITKRSAVETLAYQRMSWEALKKSINGLINKVNVSNIANIIQELLQENIVRGR